MEIKTYNVKQMKSAKGFTRPVIVVKMNRQEALLTIKSLSRQIIANNPNSGRYEQYDIHGVDFSICVENKNTK